MIKRLYAVCLQFEITISGKCNQITTIYSSRMARQVLLTALSTYNYPYKIDQKNSEKQSKSSEKSK